MIDDAYEKKRRYSNSEEKKVANLYLIRVFEAGFDLFNPPFFKDDK